MHAAEDAAQCCLSWLCAVKGAVCYEGHAHVLLQHQASRLSHLPHCVLLLLRLHCLLRGV